MRLVLVLVVALIVAGCGAAEEETNVPASSGEEPDVTVGPTVTDPPEPRPPTIVLKSEVGLQEAVQGSFCANYVDPGSGQGQGVCGDSPAVHPSAVTAVAHGDEVSFVLTGAKVVRPSGCHSDDEQACIGYVYVRPLGCEDRETKRLPLALGAETRWTVDLGPGAYELDVFGYFASDEGATGDVSGSLGLTVAGAKKYDALGVSAVRPAMQVCEFTE